MVDQAYLLQAVREQFAMANFSELRGATFEIGRKYFIEWCCGRRMVQVIVKDGKGRRVEDSRICQICRVVVYDHPSGVDSIPVARGKW